ncbi:MAG: HAMP domain-containing protein, partial [Candidatus Omnitrophica bacterium]|nr:HAMP domain-containing protein [Candidatus Omnitrophota bacterium]
SPVLKLKDAADRIASGDLDTAVDIRTKDEIGILADSFNRMARDLKASRQKLEGWAKALELKVRERTLELREKLEELEKFNKLSVDRELKMMELKKEIERLKNKVDEK